jgi:6-phosphogluconolactonase
MKTFRTRATWAVCAFALAVALTPGLAAAAGKVAKSYFVYVGSYTRVTGKGIYGYRYTPATGEMAPLGLIQESINPGWLSETPDHRFIYAAHDGPGAANFTITAYARDAKTGALTLLNTVPSKGDGPVQMTVAKTGKVLVVANFGSAGVAPTVVSFPIQADGSLGESISSFAETGVAEGPAVPRDANGNSPTDTHDHCIIRSPDSRFVLVCNLGLGKVYVYRLNSTTGVLERNGEPFVVPSPTGGKSRPHHLTFSANGKFVYILDGDMAVVTAAYDAANGKLKAIQTQPVVATPPPGANSLSGSEIIADPTGRSVYISARSVDKTLKNVLVEGSINVFAVNPKTGKLKPVQQLSSGGFAPRTFVLDPTGRYLFMANQLSGAITVFAVDPKTGALTPTGRNLKDVPEPGDFLFEAEK